MTANSHHISSASNPHHRAAAEWEKGPQHATTGFPKYGGILRDRVTMWRGVFNLPRDLGGTGILPVIYGQARCLSHQAFKATPTRNSLHTLPENITELPHSVLRRAEAGKGDFRFLFACTASCRVPGNERGPRSAPAVQKAAFRSLSIGACEKISHWLENLSKVRRN